MEVLQVDKLNCICCYTQRRTYGGKNAVLPKPLLKKCTINCLTYGENTRQPYNDNNLCLFGVLALRLHGNQRLEETSKIFNWFVNKMDGLSPNQFKGVHMNDIPIVEYLLILKILLFDIDTVDGNIIGELARRSVQKYDKTVRLLRYNNHICYVSNIKVVFQSFRCPNCDSFFNRTFKLERHLTTCSERKKYLSEERISNPGNSLWQTGLFWYRVHKSTKPFQKLSNVQFWIDLWPRRVLQRYKDNNVYWKACSYLGFQFLKPCGRTNFSLQLWSSPPRFNVYWNTGRSGVAT